MPRGAVPTNTKGAITRQGFFDGGWPDTLEKTTTLDKKDNNFLKRLLDIHTKMIFY